MEVAASCLILQVLEKSEAFSLVFAYAFTVVFCFASIAASASCQGSKAMET